MYETQQQKMRISMLTIKPANKLTRNAMCSFAHKFLQLKSYSIDLKQIVRVSDRF